MSHDLIEVPNVVGLPWLQARNVLALAGFEINTVRREPCFRDVVTRQYFGTLPRGTAINIVLSQGPVVNAGALERLAHLISAWRSGPKLNPAAFIDELEKAIATELEGTFDGASKP